MPIQIIVIYKFMYNKGHNCNFESFLSKNYQDDSPHILIILVTKTTAAQNADALSYHIVRGLYFLAVVFVRSIMIMLKIRVTFYTLHINYFKTLQW